MNPEKQQKTAAKLQRIIRLSENSLRVGQARRGLWAIARSETQRARADQMAQTRWYPSKEVVDAFEADLKKTVDLCKEVGRRQVNGTLTTEFAEYVMREGRRFPLTFLRHILI